jgi:fimbrial isopeptide formation D2 family protein
MIISTFTVSGSSVKNYGLLYIPGDVEFDKEVWNGTDWTETTEAMVGDTVDFKLTMTYKRDQGSPYTWELNKIKVKDVLPDCLEYDSLISVTTSGTHQIQYTEEIVDKTIYWNFTDDKPELDHDESLYIKFNTTVVPNEETQNQNWAFFTAKENCEYGHTGNDDATVNVVLPDSRFEKKVWNGDDWVDFAIGLLHKKMTFKLEFEYYGYEDLYYVSFKDVLPCVLNFSEVIETSINISVEVSGDNKIVWFNLSEDVIINGDIVVINFIADVTGITGGYCPDIVENKAWLYILDCTGQIINTLFDEVTLKTIENHAPCVPIISDDAEGIVGEELTFYILGHDPDGDDIYYYIDWGDDSVEEWIGPFESGVEKEVKHIWTEEGEYTVKAKAKDVWGEEGYWGNEITVDIGVKQVDLNVKIKIFFRRFVKVDIENTGEKPINDITWNITVWNRLLTKRFKRTNGTIETLEAGETVMKQARPFRLFRFITVSVNVNSSDLSEPIHRHAKGFIFGRFVFLRPYKFFLKE